MGSSDFLARILHLGARPEWCREGYSPFVVYACVGCVTARLPSGRQKMKQMQGDCYSKFSDSHVSGHTGYSRCRSTCKAPYPEGGSTESMYFQPMGGIKMMPESHVCTAVLSSSVSSYHTPQFVGCFCLPFVHGGAVARAGKALAS